MGILLFTPLTDAEMKQYDLLKLENQRVLLSPKEKYDRLIKKVSNGSPKRIKKFHFFTIEQGKDIYLFDGIGIEIQKYENSIKGYRAARLEALTRFNSAKVYEKTGGFQFTPDKNLEFQSDEEIQEQFSSTMKQISYHPFFTCKDCKQQFEEKDEYDSHVCQKIG